MITNHSLKISLALLTCMVLSVSCSKKDKVEEMTKTAIITTSSWRYDTAGIDLNGDGTGETAIPPGILESCDTDNIITFKSDKTGTVDEGATKCSSSDPQSVPFTWELINNENEINFNTAIFVGVSGVAKIVELTPTKFVLSKRIDMQGIPLPVTAVITLKR
jgi:hypothetical protein